MAVTALPPSETPWQRIVSWFRGADLVGPLLPPPAPDTRAPLAVAGRPRPENAPLPLVGTVRTGPRLTDDGSPLGLGGMGGVLVPPDNPEGEWRLQSLDEDALRRLPPSRLMRLLCDLSPDVGRALFDFLRLSNAGWTFKAKRPAAAARPSEPGAAQPDQTAPIDAAAQATLDAMLAALKQLYGSPDVQFNRMFIAAWMRGAFMAEVVLDADYRFADLVAPDPIIARFRVRKDSVRGNVWELGQINRFAGTPGSAALGAAGQFVSLETPTVRYVPVDPFPGSPYGRPLCSPALFVAIFLLGLLHDLRRVVAQQGYMRLDVSIDMEQLRLTMPPDEMDDPVKFREWAEDSITQVSKVMASLKPDDTFVHTSVSTVNRPVGTVNSDFLTGVDSLLRALERLVTRALKSMPLMMGSTEGMSEANANRQWEINAAGIKSMQHLMEGMLEHLFGVALQQAGTPAVVEARFAELRASEALRDAQTDTLRIQNARQKYEAGFASQDEASVEVTGHLADAPEPRAGIGLKQPDLAAQAGDNKPAAGAMTGKPGGGEPKSGEDT